MAQKLFAATDEEALFLDEGNILSSLRAFPFLKHGRGGLPKRNNIAPIQV